MENNRETSYDSPVKAMFTGIRDLFRKQQGHLSLDEADRLDGKNVMITGASSGLGFAISVELARRGAHVIMVARSGIPGKGDQVKLLSGSGKIDMLYADFAEISSVYRLAEDVKKNFGALDIAIFNAAMVARSGRRLETGLDEMFTVNYLAPYMLSTRLIESGCFRTSGNTAPRLIFVASESHRNPGEFNWEGFGRYEPYSMKRSVELYGYYKLLLVTFINELSRRLNPDEKTRYSVFSLCPGPVNTNIAREAPRLFQPLLHLIFRVFFKSPQKACKPVIYHAVSPKQEGKPIDYLFLMQHKAMDPKATDPDNGKRLWKATEQLVRRINRGMI